MGLSRWVFLVITLFICSTSQFGTEASVNGPTQQKINTICHQTEDYGFCSEVFNENLKSPSASIQDLMNITMDQASKNSSSTYFFISQILRNAFDPTERYSLQMCAEAYIIVNMYFSDAQRYFTGGQYDKMRHEEINATKFLDNCKTNFTVPSYPVNPLIEKNGQMRILATMAAVTGGMLS